MISDPVAKPTESAEKVWRVGTLTYTKAGLVVLFFWLLIGDFAWAIKDRSVTYVVQLLIKKFEASDTVSGFILGTVPQALSLVLAPIISFRSDRHRGRWGRRMPFLMIPTPIAALSIIGLAFSPELGTWLHQLLGDGFATRNNTILLVLGFFWMLFEVATVTAFAVFYALINDVVPKEVLGRFYGLFRAIGLIVAMVFNFWLFGKAEQHYLWLFIAIGTLYGVGFMAMCFKVKEGDYPPPPPVPERRRNLIDSMVTYFRESFTNSYYLWVYAAVAFGWMAVLTVNLYNIFFAKSLSMSMDTYGKYLAATFLISFTVSYVLGVFADRFHPLRLSIVLMGLFAAVTLAGGLLAKSAYSFGLALVAYGVVSGAWQTSTASLTLRLFPQARFAQFDSARGLVTSLGMALVGPAMGMILDSTGHAYRYTYIAGAILASIAMVAGLVVYRRFRQLGGPANYQPPE